MLKQITSHLQRLNTPCVIACSLVPQDTSVFVKEQVEFDGRIITRTTTKTVNVGSILSKFKASDFALENLLAIGATDHLRPIGPLCSNDIDTTLLSLDSVMDLVDAMDAKSVVSSSDSSSSITSNSEIIKDND